MKLKNIFEIETIEDKKFMVCLDSSVFAGMIELNETAAFIIECLKEETTIDGIIDKIKTVYDVEREDVVGYVEQIVTQLKNINVLDN